MVRTLFTLPFLLATLGRAAYANSIEYNKRLENGLGRTPALGWNSWNVGGCSAGTAAHALTTAKAFVGLGLKDLGYNYVNIDDCWATKDRNSAGEMVPDPSKWPNGVKAVADQIHGMGLKFGLYGSSGTKTCEGYPGSQGYEIRDARLLASWGVDYWKYDNCYTPSGNSSGRFITMRDALTTSGRPILYSICQWGNDNVWTWGKSVGNSWRTTGDIQNNWNSIVKIGSHAGSISTYSGPRGFNDLDMMALIAINQDPLGEAAAPFQPRGKPAPQSGKLYPYWAGPISNSGVVIGLIAAENAATLSVDFADVPGLGTGTFKWSELYGGASGLGTSVSAALSLHDMAVFKVTKA